MLSSMDRDPPAAARAHRGVGADAMRFPCGHTEPDDSVGQRLRVTPRAVWIACVRCNVVALVVGPSTGARSARRTPGDRRSRHGTRQS
jgi:hypothetical protein